MYFMLIQRSLHSHLLTLDVSLAMVYLEVVKFQQQKNKNVFLINTVNHAILTVLKLK